MWFYQLSEAWDAGCSSLPGRLRGPGAFHLKARAAVELVLDIGGEGRHKAAWNLNLRRLRTLGPQRGQPIPRHILGRAEAIPWASGTVDQVIVERTPLRVNALKEIVRVTAPDGLVILRHACIPGRDPHLLAREIVPGWVTESTFLWGQMICLETLFRPGG